MKTIIVGIGNPFIESDSIGIEVAKAVKDRIKADVEILSTTSIDLLYSIIGYDRAIIIDSISETEIAIIDDHDDSEYVNSHTISLFTTLKLGFELFPNEMPEIEIIGVGKAEVEKVVDLIIYEVCFA